MPRPGSAYIPPMKSCLGLLITLIIFTLVIGGGGLIWYLSSSSEFSRDASPPVPATEPQRR
jgi:hypothetical protein